MSLEEVEERKSWESAATTNRPAIICEDVPQPLPALADVLDNLKVEQETRQAIIDTIPIIVPEKRLKDDFGFYADTKDASPHIDLTPAVRNRVDLSNGKLEDLSSEEQSQGTRRAEEPHVRYTSNFPHPKIKNMCRRGIPDSIRGKAWMFLSGADRKRIDGKFAELLSGPERPAIFDVIERDVHRCFPNLTGQGQADIRRVLQAYALYNPKLGYCQGMGMIVGLFLMRMPAEDSFWTLVAVLENFIPEYHSTNLYELRVDAAAFEVCLKKYLGPLSKHMKELIPLTYMTQWFLTVYTMALPWNTVLRVWDMFLHDGPKALFRTGLAILKGRRSYIILNCPTPSDILAFLLSAPKEIKDADKFIEECLSISLGHQQLDKIRKQVKRAHASLEDSINKTTSTAALS